MAGRRSQTDNCDVAVNKKHQTATIAADEMTHRWY